VVLPGQDPNSIVKGCLQGLCIWFNSLPTSGSYENFIFLFFFILTLTFITRECYYFPMRSVLLLSKDEWIFLRAASQWETLIFSSDECRRRKINVEGVISPLSLPGEKRLPFHPMDVKDEQVFGCWGNNLFDPFDNITSLWEVSVLPSRGWEEHRIVTLFCMLLPSEKHVLRKLNEMFSKCWTKAGLVPLA